MGHLGTGLTFGLPFGLLVFAAAAIIGKPWLGLAPLAWTVAARVFQSVLVGWYVVKDRDAVRLACLYPLRDLMGSLLWMASYASRRVGWRDDFFELRKRGVVRLIPAEERRTSAHQ
jgi:ceramide glucosyltransferase